MWNYLLTFKSKGLFFCFCYTGIKLWLIIEMSSLLTSTHLGLNIVGVLHWKNVHSTSLAPHTSEYENFLPRKFHPSTQ